MNQNELREYYYQFYCYYFFNNPQLVPKDRNYSEYIWECVDTAILINQGLSESKTR